MGLGGDSDDLRLGRVGRRGDAVDVTCEQRPGRAWIENHLRTRPLKLGGGQEGDCD